MPTGTIDSAIFRTFSAPRPCGSVWSDGNRIQKYLDFEAGLARAQARLKIIPQEACDEILKHCHGRPVRLREAQEGNRAHRLSGAAGGAQLVKLCKDGLGEWCHWGATTQDITDTATIMQIREGLAIIEQDIDAISDALAALAQEIPRHADGRPQQSAAGGADHLRLQDARPISRPSSATSSG